MRRFVVLNPDGSYAGRLCYSYDEAVELASQKSGRVIGEVFPCQNATKHFHCIPNNKDCPHYDNACGNCKLDNPEKNCEDFAWLTEEEDYSCSGGWECPTWYTDE